MQFIMAMRIGEVPTWHIYGCDENGNNRARKHEEVIIDSCLKDAVTPQDKIRLFSQVYPESSKISGNINGPGAAGTAVPVALIQVFYLTRAKQGLSGEL